MGEGALSARLPACARRVLGRSAHRQLCGGEEQQLADGAKANHLAYLGDATVGERVNYGAGSITANYDGANKHRTVIEADVHIGSNCVLVAPVTIGAGGTVGGGSTITKSTEPGALSVARGKQVSIANWQRLKNEAPPEALCAFPSGDDRLLAAGRPLLAVLACVFVHGALVPRCAVRANLLVAGGEIGWCRRPRPHPEQLRAALAASQRRWPTWRLRRRSFCAWSRTTCAPLRHITSLRQAGARGAGRPARRCAAKPAAARSARVRRHHGQSARRMGTDAGRAAFVARGACAVAPAAGGLGRRGRKSPGRAAHWQRPRNGAWPPTCSTCRPTQPCCELLAQVLGNALKFSQHQPAPALRCAPCPQRSGAGWVAWKQQDNGAGFNPERAAGLFGIFQRLHRETEFDGVGAGLACAAPLLNATAPHERARRRWGRAARCVVCAAAA